MHRRRKHPRHTKRLEVTFKTGETKFRGISSDLSEGGMFIRTQNGLTPGTTVEVALHLPGEKICRMKGIVRRTIKTALTMIKNGMGIELLDPAPEYIKYVKGFYELGMSDQERATPPAEQEVKQAAHVQEAPRGSETASEETTPPKPPEAVIISCTVCGAKNRVPVARLSMKPKCGKCGEHLPTGDAG